jgi:hypothetical protein
MFVLGLLGERAPLAVPDVLFNDPLRVLRALTRLLPRLDATLFFRWNVAIACKL